jgi:hypothetical protein
LFSKAQSPLRQEFLTRILVDQGRSGNEFVFQLTLAFKRLMPDSAPETALPECRKLGNSACGPHGFNSRRVDSPKNLSQFGNFDCDGSKKCINATSHPLNAPTSSRKNGRGRIRDRQDLRRSISRKRFIFNYRPLFPPKDCMTNTRAVEREAHSQKLRTTPKEP